MKKKLFLIMASLIVLSSIVYSYEEIDEFVPKLTPIMANDEVDNEITGDEEGSEIIFNSQFDDIANDPNERDIAKLGASQIIEKYDTKSYKPNTNINGYQALSFLLRYLGNEEQIQQNVLNQSDGLALDTVKNLFNEEYLAQAQNAGIILENEVPKVGKPITRSTLAKWIFRTANYNQEFNDLSKVFDFNDHQDINPADRPIIQTIVQKEIMGTDKNNNFNPKGLVTKSEMAKVINNLVKDTLEERNIEKQVGIITEIENIEDENFNKSIYVKNNDDTITKIDLKTKEPDKNDFVVYKENKVSSSKVLDIGDEVNYYIQDNQVYFMEVINQLNNIEKSYIQNTDDLNTLLATVKDISYEKVNPDIQRIRVRILSLDGNTYDIIVDKPKDSNQNMTLYKNNKMTTAKDFELNDRVKLIVNDNDEVLYAKVGDFTRKEIQGTIRTVNDDQIEIFDYDGNIVTYPLSNYYILEINKRPASLDELSYGQDASITINNGKITSINIETFLNPGYIPKEGISKDAKVHMIASDIILFQLQDGEIVNYNLNNDSVIIKNGNQVTPKALKEGDKVRLYFDEINSKEVSKLEIEGKERLVKQIYKGNLKSFNPNNMMLTLTNPSYLKNISWLDSPEYVKKLKLDDKVQLYNGDQKVAVRNLMKYFRDDLVYVVVENSYGNEKGIKLAIKSGSKELVISDQVDSIEKPLNKLELKNNLNVNYNNGTIIIKNGRMVSKDLLKAKDTVLAVSEYNQGMASANILKVIRQNNNVFENIYVGTIEDVNYNSINLDYYSYVEDNEFDNLTMSDSDPFYYFTETKIQDITEPNNKIDLDSRSLFHGSYSKEENEKNHNDFDYQLYYTYFITDGHSGIIDMKIRHKGIFEDYLIDDEEDDRNDAEDTLQDLLEDAIFSRGIASEFINDERIRVSEPYDYIEYKDGWIANNSDIYVEFEDAIIVKNNKSITVDEIDIGDYLYFTRFEENALVIYVEDE